MEIILTNTELVLVHNACHNAQDSSTGIQGRTRMTLDDIIEAIKSKRESFQRHLSKEISQHVAHDEDGNPKTTQGPQGQMYVFKSPEHEEQYLAFTDMEHTFDIDLLGREELGNIITTNNQFGRAADHYQALKLVTEGFARRLEQESNSNETN